MIRQGDVITLEIKETNMLGNGIAKSDGMVVFCRGAVGGDVVQAVVTDVRKNFAVADVLNTVFPSPARQEPACPHAAECGGCAFAGVSYSHECEVKRAGVAAAMRREGVRAAVGDLISGSERGYRNKAVFHFDENGNCGYFAEGTNTFVKIEKCLICDEKINIIKNEVQRLAAGCGLAAKDLSYLYIRYMKETDEASVVLGYRGGEDLSSFAKELTAAVPCVKGVFRGRGRSPESKDERFELIAGEERITAKIAGVDLALSPASFFQVNTSQAQKLCETAVRLAALKDGERAADIYCGAGLFGLALAKSAPGAEVYGIEINDDAVRDANRNAERCRVKNAFFLQGDSSELKSKTGIDSLDVAVVDPPRTGLSKKTIAEIIDLSPERIVYVSCNPSTLARDIKLLSDSYSIDEVVGVDMFPRTKHVESVVLMTRLG